MSFQTCKTSVHLRNTNSDIFDEFRALSVPPIDSKDPYTIKVQKQSNVLCQHHAHVYAQIKAHIYTYVILSKMAPGWSGGDKLLNKCVIFVFFAHKNILIASKHYGWTTDVTWIIITMSLRCFWTLNVVVPLRSMQVRILSDFIKNILTCGPKTNNGLNGLERHEGELLMT